MSMKTVETSRGNFRIRDDGFVNDEVAALRVARKLGYSEVHVGASQPGGCREVHMGRTYRGHSAMAIEETVRMWFPTYDRFDIG